MDGRMCLGGARGVFGARAGRGESCSDDQSALSRVSGEGDPWIRAG